MGLSLLLITLLTSESAEAAPAKKFAKQPLQLSISYRLVRAFLMPKSAMRCSFFFSLFCSVRDPVWSKEKPIDQQYCDCAKLASRGITQMLINLGQSLSIQWNGVQDPLLRNLRLLFLVSTQVHIRVDCVQLMSTQRGCTVVILVQRFSEL